MKKVNFNFLSVLLISSMIIWGCKKDSTSDTSTTSTTTNKAPSSVMVTVPANGATNVSLATTSLNWAASTDPDGDIVTYDIYFGTSSLPALVKSGNTTLSYSVSGLIANTTYYWKVVARDDKGNAADGTVWSFKTGSSNTGGNEIVFNPNLTYGTLTDSRDNKTYKTIVIGTQTWMAQNLNYSTTSGSWCYEDNSSNCNVYGRLYNWETANGGVCPTGWHLPSDAEWTTLSTYLGGETVAGGKMKETGTTHWNSPNTGADNSSGFTALPAGNTNSNDVSFHNRGENAFYWSSTEFNVSHSYVRSLFSSNAKLYSYDDYDKLSGVSVRCIKN